MDNAGRKTSYFYVDIDNTRVFSDSGLNNSGTKTINRYFNVSDKSNVKFIIAASDTNQYQYVNYSFEFL